MLLTDFFELELQLMMIHTVKPQKNLKYIIQNKIHIILSPETFLKINDKNPLIIRLLYSFAD